MLLINGFSKACKNIVSSYLKVGVDTMSATLFLTIAKGELSHLSYILFKTEPLGKDVNTVDCYFTEALIFIDITREKKG